MSERGEEIQQETIRKRINEVISDIERQVCREEDEDRAENEVKSSAEENSVSKSCHEVNVPEKVLTPSSDGCLLIPSRRAMFVDSAFFSPAVHPTWEQQVQMAKKISTSLSHSSNRMSRGQSMYEKRKRRSQNWVHQGDGDGREEQEDLSQHPKKPLIKLLMRPNGQAYDIQALQDEDRPPASKELLSPEIFSGLVKDLSSPDCKGAQIFAKRKKRSECWIVDDLHREQRGGGRQAASDSVEPPQGPGGADVPHPQGIPSVTPFNRDGLEQNGRTKYSLKPFSLNPGERSETKPVHDSGASDLLLKQKVRLRPASDRVCDTLDSAFQQAELEFVAAASQLMARRNASAERKEQVSDSRSQTDHQGSAPQIFPDRPKQTDHQGSTPLPLSDRPKQRPVANVVNGHTNGRENPRLENDFISRSSKTQVESHGYVSKSSVQSHQSSTPVTNHNHRNSTSGAHCSAPERVDDSSGMYFQCAVTVKQTTVPNVSQQNQRIHGMESSRTGDSMSQAKGDINSVAASSISSHEPVFSKARTEHQTPPSQGLSVFPSAEVAVNSGTRSCFSNYNTAARGWGVTSGFYRPVTFSHR